MLMRTTMVLMTLPLSVMACGTTQSTPQDAPAPLPEPQVAADSQTTEEEQLVATALTDAACQDTELCALAGYCKSSGGDCVVGTDDDCKQSKQCQTDGACSAGEDECVAKSDEDLR